MDGLCARFEAPEICLGDKLPAPRGEQQQIGLLKQFSWTGGLLSACQQPDYSIQLFCCSQSAQRAPAAGPHGYLSIPDTGINTAAPQRRRTEGYRKCNLMWQHPQLLTTSNTAAEQKRPRGRPLSSVKPENFQYRRLQLTTVGITSNG